MARQGRNQVTDLTRSRSPQIVDRTGQRGGRLARCLPDRILQLAHRSGAHILGCREKTVAAGAIGIKTSDLAKVIDRNGRV
jgi:hypothetical protein